MVFLSRLMPEIAEMRRWPSNILGTLALVSRRIIVPPVLQELEEASSPSLLEQTHQATRQRFPLVRRDLGDPAISQDIRSSNLLELQIPGDIGLDQHLSELTGCQNKFRNEIDSIVSIPAEILGRGGASELLVELYERFRGCNRLQVELTYLSEVQTRRCSSIIVFSVHVQYLLALDGQKARQHALAQSSALER